MFLSAEGSTAGFNGALSFAGAADAEDPIFFAHHAVIVDEELLQFVQKLITQIVDVLDVRKAVIVLLDGDDAVIARFLLFLELFAFNDSNETALEHTARKSGLVHEHQYVYGIAVVGQSRGNEPEVIGEGHAGG